MRFLPTWIIRYVRLERARSAHRSAAYINSPDVSISAQIGNGVGIDRTVVINPGVHIGDYTYINRGSIVFSGKIGKFCSIGHYTMIGGQEHPLHHLSTSPYTYGQTNILGATVDVNELSAPPEIGNDVWIAAGAVVLQGVKIGHGAVIAASAVVTKDVEAYSIVAGTPARKISQRFADAEIARLLKSEWWDHIDDARVVAAVDKGTEWQSNKLPGEK